MTSSSNAGTGRARSSSGAPAVALLALTLLLGCGSTTRPFDDVFLVTIDTLRADHLGCYGYPRPVSPFIDSLAARGVRFERVVASSSHTGPSHASLFTSQYPARHGVLVNGANLRAEIPSMASLLSGAGFETAAFLSVDFLRSVTHGFSSVDARLPARQRYRRAEGTVDAALAWLGETERSRRRFVWIHLYDVHQTRPTDRVPRPELEAGLRKSARRDADVLRPFWMEHLGAPPGQVSAVTWKLNRYDAQLAYVDEELLRLFETVEAAGRRALWILTADHGEGLGSHNYLGHGRHLYQAQLAVPLIFEGDERWPGGASVDAMARHVDLLPTVLELAGVAAPPASAFEGHSLAPWIERPSAPKRASYAFSQRRPPDDRRLRSGWPPGLVISAQDGRYKYILSTAEGDEFYDLRADPTELRNLIGEDLEAKEEILRWLTRKYESMIADPLAAADEIDDQFVEELKALGYL